MRQVIEAFKILVFFSLGIFILLFSEPYFAMTAAQRNVLGIALLAYGLYKTVRLVIQR